MKDKFGEKNRCRKPRKKNNVNIYFKDELMQLTRMVEGTMEKMKQINCVFYQTDLNV